MKQRDDVDRVLTAWFEATAPTREPEFLLDAVLTQAARTRRRPTWRIPERWLPVDTTLRLQRMPRLAPVLVVLGLLLIAALVALVVAGSPRRLPAPYGLADNGRLAYISDGQVWTANPDGSDAHAITSNGAVKGVPIWSRDGTRLAFVAYTVPFSTERASLIVANADGSNPITIVGDMKWLWYVSWSPDGTSIAYSACVHEPGQCDRIFLAAADGSSPPRQIGDDSLSAFNPAFSPDGKHIAFFSDHCESAACTPKNVMALHVMAADGTDVRQLSRVVVGVASAEEHGTRGIDWSPDGTRILFVGNESREESINTLYVIPADGSSAELRVSGDVRVNPPLNYGATWSPEGDRIVYLRGSQGGVKEVIVSNASGTEVDVVATGSSWFSPQWSPDGRSIVVIDPSSASGGAIRVIPLEGEGPPVVIPTTTISTASDTAPGIDSIGWQRIAR